MRQRQIDIAIQDEEALQAAVRNMMIELRDNVGDVLCQRNGKQCIRIRYNIVK